MCQLRQPRPRTILPATLAGANMASRHARISETCTELVEPSRSTRRDGRPEVELSYPSANSSCQCTRPSWPSWPSWTCTSVAMKPRNSAVAEGRRPPVHELFSRRDFFYPAPFFHLWPALHGHPWTPRPLICFSDELSGRCLRPPNLGYFVSAKRTCKAHVSTAARHGANVGELHGVAELFARGRSRLFPSPVRAGPSQLDPPLA
jgi:hypothetical protein